MVGSFLCTRAVIAHSPIILLFPPESAHLSREVGNMHKNTHTHGRWGVEASNELSVISIPQVGLMLEPSWLQRTVDGLLKKSNYDRLEHTNSSTHTRRTKRCKHR